MGEILLGQAADRDLGESKQRLSQEIIDDLIKIWDLENHVPKINPEDPEDKEKMSPEDPGYYESKVPNSVFNNVRYKIRTIFAQNLVADINVIEGLRNDEDTINEIISSRKGMHDTLEGAGKTGRQIREYQNRFVKEECDELDEIIVRVINALKGEYYKV
jgi:hypothetical protein